MTPDSPFRPDSRAAGDEQDLRSVDLDGHTLDELTDYLDSGRSPVDPSIENSPGCRIALAALLRLRTAANALIEAEAAAEAGKDDRWVKRILSGISRDAHAGRDIPVRSDDPAATLVLTEGAVRGMVRAAGDGVDGVLMGRCRLDGDVTEPGAPIAVTVEISVLFGQPIPDTAARVRSAVARELAKHTELAVSSIDVDVRDVQFIGRNEPA